MIHKFNKEQNYPTTAAFVKKLNPDSLILCLEDFTAKKSLLNDTTVEDRQKENLQDSNSHSLPNAWFAALTNGLYQPIKTD
jgi:hypothetical protein